MDHNNLTYENFTTEIVMRWILLLEEYGPKIKYIKGPDNDEAEVLSRLSLIKYGVKYSNITREYLVKSYCSTNYTSTISY